MSMIRYIKHHEIDKKQWDHCIAMALNRAADCLSWYLDITCPNWDALILDDYNAVMPLPVRRKFGISYIYKPLFIQQLGLFGNNVSTELLHSFLERIPAGIKLADIVLNESNEPPAGDYRMVENNNHKLELKQSYEKIEQHYHRNCRRNIKKAQEAGLTFTPGITIREFTDLLEEQIKSQAGSFGKQKKNQFHRLLKQTLEREAGELVGVHNKNGNLAAVGFYLFSFESLMFKICGSSPEGKKNQAMYLLVDEQIKRYTGKYDWYDFQGSNIEGIAYFNSTFGAIPQKYYILHVNKLPYFIRKLTGGN